jgi:glutamate-ammonia-ligase adenylyltransferase
MPNSYPFPAFPQQQLELLPAGLRERVQHQWQGFVEALQHEQIAPPEAGEWSMSLPRVWACSEFITNSCVRQPAMLCDLVESGDLFSAYPVGHYRALLRPRLEAVNDENSLGVELRRFRRREMVRIAWRDLAGWAELDESLSELSALASACVDAALEKLHTWQCAELGMPMGEESGEPQALVVLGMGKLGADELNYSSDIDLIFAYPEEGETRGGRLPLSNNEFFIRLGRRLINVINQATAEGFVFRVDMRLRPFGDAGPLAISFAAMEDYYQVHGREWERYAMIKAALVAGDRQAGAELVAALRPFIYRRYLDYGAFESLREMKAMIAAEVQRKGMADNIKLGPGGIREVEFIGQAYQLIRGGREKVLQIRPIQQVLDRLAELDCLPAYVVTSLKQAYVFLRRVENRLQAMHDRQTHTLPTHPLDRQRLVLAMDYVEWAEFEKELRRHMAHVHDHFEQVFAAPQREQAAEQGSEFDAVWSGQAVAEIASNILQRHGYQQPDEVLRLLERLREGSACRSLSVRGRERLDRLMPLLLGAVASVEQPETVLVRLVSLIETIARRTAYLALLVENPMALSQLVKLCAASPWIAAHLARYPVLLDELLDPRTLYVPLERVALESELERMLAQAGDDQEQQMEALRQFKQANVLRVAAADVAGVYPLMIVSDHLTEIAEVVLGQVVRLAYDYLASRHGVPQGVNAQGKSCPPGFIVLGYGKLGGIELGYGSDLDLVFLHGNEGEGMATAGEKSVDNNVFFARLGQRIIHMMTAHTPSGTLYDIDARLRPSGEAGMLVSNLDAFAAYQRTEAWTWEHQALVRARVVAGDGALARGFEQIRNEVLSRERETVQLQQEVRDMRQKMRDNLSRARAGLFDLKQDPGGIADIEFIVQYGVLHWAHDHPALLRWSDNIRLLETLAREGLLGEEDASLLAEAYRAYRAGVHRAALQEKEAVVTEGQFAAERDAVLHIWQDLLETVK